LTDWTPFKVHGEFGFSDEAMHGQLDGLGTCQKVGQRFGLNLGCQKLAQSLAGSVFAKNPMGLFCRLFNCTRSALLSGIIAEQSGSGKGMDG
jgi:hypothetical protein